MSSEIKCMQNVSLEEFPQSISFDKITEGKQVRVTPKSFEKEIHISCIDFVALMNDIDTKEGARQYRNLFENHKIPQSLKEELLTHIKRYQFEGQGQREQDVVSLEGALILLDMMFSPKALAYKSQARKIVVHWIKKEVTLYEENRSQHNMNVQNDYVCCKTNEYKNNGILLDHDPFQTSHTYKVESKRRRDEIELELMETELREKKTKVLGLEIETKRQLINMYKSLCPSQQMDDATISNFQKWLKESISIGKDGLANGYSFNTDQNKINNQDLGALKSSNVKHGYNSFGPFIKMIQTGIETQTQDGIQVTCKSVIQKIYKIKNTSRKYIDKIVSVAFERKYNEPPKECIDILLKKREVSDRYLHLLNKCIDTYNQKGYVYAIKLSVFPGAVKIGCTTNIKKRIFNAMTFLRLSSCTILSMSPSLKYREDEKIAHCFFRDKHLKGEFFRVTDMEINDYFTTLNLKFDKQILDLVTQ